MNFRTGQKVVCIHAKGTGPSKPLIKGEIYTVRETGVHDSYTGLRLVEIINETRWFPGYGVVEIGYLSTRFAPLSERTSESEAFAETLITELETEINQENLIEK